MDKVELFCSIEKVVNEAYDKLCKDEHLKTLYLNNDLKLNNDLTVLRKTLDYEISYCKTNFSQKNINNKYSDDIRIISQKNNGEHDLFIFLPVFNATNEQAEQCIYSVLDNFVGLDYQFLIITNRNLEVFQSKMFISVPHMVLLKNVFSLPESYNILFSYARKNAESENSIITLMDDDAYILTGQCNKVQECIERIRSDQYVATSGHYYDITPPRTVFQQMINVSHTFTFVDKYRKPYCHGGACFMIKIKNFPSLTINGLGGISVNILSFQKFLRDKKNYDSDLYWCLYNDTEFKVFHPRKKNLFAWIATYLSYEIAWKNAMDLLDKRTYEIFKSNLLKCSKKRIHGLHYGIINSENSYLYLGNLFFTRYLKPMLQDNLIYSEFKKYKINTHINLN